MTSPVLPDHQGTSVQRVLPENLVAHRNGVTVWLSNIKRDGEWILPRIFRTFTFMGDVKLDTTNARMGNGESEIEILSIFGNVEITVPPDVRVLCEGDGFMGTFEIVRVGEMPPLAPDAPTLKVKGTAWLSSVKVKVEGKVGPGWKDKLKAWSQRNS